MKKGSESITILSLFLFIIGDEEKMECNAAIRFLFAP